MYNHSAKGLQGEQQAANFLKRKKKLKILQTNFETSFGEIDVVCLQTPFSAFLQKRKLKKLLPTVLEAQQSEIKQQIAKKQLEQKQKTLVFVEVKTRSAKSNRVARPSDAVDFKKINKYQQLAQSFATQNPKYNNCDWRFDIVEVIESNGQILISHLEHAF